MNNSIETLTGKKWKGRILEDVITQREENWKEKNGERERRDRKVSAPMAPAMCGWLWSVVVIWSPGLLWVETHVHIRNWCFITLVLTRSSGHGQCDSWKILEVWWHWEEGVRMWLSVYLSVPGQSSWVIFQSCALTKWWITVWERDQQRKKPYPASAGPIA